MRAHAAASEAVGLAEWARRSGEGGSGLEACLATLALVEAGLGRAHDCRVHAGRVISGPRADPRAVAHAESARALLALAGADHATALGHLDEAAELTAGPGRTEGVLRWGADHVEAAAGSGDRDLARRLLRGLTACAGVVRSPDLDAVALRAAGLVAGPLDADLLFQEALEQHASRPVPFEWARTSLCYGEHLLGDGRRDEAEDHLAAARTAFARLGARGWLSRCGRAVAA